MALLSGSACAERPSVLMPVFMSWLMLNNPTYYMNDKLNILIHQCPTTLTAPVTFTINVVGETNEAERV